MKKTFIVVLLAFCGLAQAQVTFRPGLRGGVNFSHFTKGNDELYYEDNIPDGNDRRFSSKTDFYIGFYGALRLTKYYTLQPEVNYTRQGSEFSNGAGYQSRLDVSYLSVGVANKFTFTDKFNVHVGPTIEFQVDDNFNTDSEVDLAFFLGAGYHFTKNFGIEGRVKKGIVPVLDYSDGNHTNVVFSLGATYTFDLK